MRLTFYQTSFHDVNLVDIATLLGHPLDMVANASIYEAVYDQLQSTESFGIDDIFIKRKHRLSAWIKNIVSKKSEGKPYRILSVGCGTGLVEVPLIQSGYTVDLQECQRKSIQYIREYFPDELNRSKVIISSDLDELESQSYDCVMAITSSYPLNDKELKNFFNSVHKLLKPGGIFLLYDNSYVFKHLIKQFYWSVRNTKHAGIKWGYKRSIKNWKNLIKETGLKYDDHAYFDVNNDIIKTPEIFGLPLNDRIFWQMAVFVRSKKS